ncbi:uncharacterized protein LOC144350636 [Saccoglossus kowalevskii]
MLVQTLMLNNCTWITIGTAQLFLRCHRFIYSNNTARMSYIVIGWILPIVLMGGLIIWNIDDFRSSPSCWLVDNVYIFYISATCMTMLTIISYGILLYVYRVLYLNHPEYEESELLEFYYELLSLFLLVGIWPLAITVGYIAYTYNDVVVGFIFGAAIFTTGSTYFLTVCITNIELLVAIRIRLSGDVDYIEALHQRIELEKTRMDMRKDCQFMENQMDNLAQSRRKKKVEKERQVAAKINTLFTMGRLRQVHPTDK